MSAVRLGGWALVILALILVGQIVGNEVSGETEIPRRYFPTPYDQRLKKVENPQQFRSIITFKWYRALICAGGGLLLLAIARRADRLDPFHPDFAGNHALDEWGESLQKKESKPGIKQEPPQAKD